MFSISTKDVNNLMEFFRKIKSGDESDLNGLISKQEKKHHRSLGSATIKKGIKELSEFILKSSEVQSFVKTFVNMRAPDERDGLKVCMIACGHTNDRTPLTDAELDKAIKYFNENFVQPIQKLLGNVSTPPSDWTPIETYLFMIATAFENFPEVFKTYPPGKRHL